MSAIPASADDDASGARLRRRAPAVLIVDDEADLRELLALTLVRLGLDVDPAANLAEARARLASGDYALCLTDMRLPDGSGLDLVREVAARSGGPRIAVITAFGSAENAVAALKAGAFDYVTKPLDLDHLRTLVRSALRDAPSNDVAAIDGRAAAGAERGALARLVGDAPAMVDLRAMIRRLASSMAPVVIFGESGSGKELVARAIHDASARRDQPFIAVNCGAIPEALMEAEFFGYRKGAFTGADRDRDGFFQAATGGTLFLDELAELPLSMQVKLLRAIQERRVRKVGDTAEAPVDVRILSATHGDLPRLVAAGRFRQDLFYRLNVIELRVPSLRERVSDIPLIARAILQRVAARVGIPGPTLSKAAEDALMRHGFPGNVRELENILERALALSGGGELQPADVMLPAAPPLGAPPPAPAADAPADDGAGAAAVGEGGDAVEAEAVSAPGASPDAPAEFVVDQGVPTNLQAYLDALERDAIRAALERTRHNRTAAAQLLGITFRQMRYRMQRLGLK
ncbi:MAG TPA: sigma-54 dependent transcriptional regulator [Burkholderiaceae bacterium]|nr:sigma-54 dependent transcriptional regulator [Burkholderiaceae bacterium]